MYIIEKQNGHVSYGLNKYVADTVADIDDIPLNCKMGSSVYVIETGDTYLLNSQYEWIKKKSTSSSGGSSSAEIEELKEENQKLTEKVT